MVADSAKSIINPIFFFFLIIISIYNLYIYMLYVVLVYVIVKSILNYLKPITILIITYLFI